MALGARHLVLGGALFVASSGGAAVVPAAHLAGALAGVVAGVVGGGKRAARDAAAVARRRAGR